MALSMTGYGRHEDQLHGRLIALEVKSVNARYFEYSSRMPRNLAFVDDPLKKAVAVVVSRGKVEVHLSVATVDSADTEVLPNLALAKGYADALAKISEQLTVPNDVSASVLARFSDIFVTKRGEGEEDELTADVLAVARGALASYNAMRAAEGKKLCEDITGRLAKLEQMVAAVEQDSAGRVQRYTDRLFERLSELLADRAVDEGRMLTEAAIFADKTAVDEETVRLRSHLKQFGENLKSGEPIGRKLDFLTQEINRETNTIGSKCQELDITRLVVDMKAEIEKIREQIQNLE